MNDLTGAKQMMGEMFSPHDLFSRAVSVTHHARTQDTERTSYLAVKMDDDMVRHARAHIPPVFTADGTGLIPHCWYERGLEAPSPRPSIRIVGDVNDFGDDGAGQNGRLQILMLEVNGERIRPDGVPYHMIWSHDDDASHSVVEDKNYQWTTNILDDAAGIYFDEVKKSFMANIFTKVAHSTRVLSTLDLRAEHLARAAHTVCETGLHHSCPDFDFFPADVALKYSSRHYAPLRRVEFVGGQRHTLDVGW